MGKNKRKKSNNIRKLRAAREKLVNNKFNAYIKMFEKKYEKEPSQEQIDKLYERAEKVVSKNIRKFGVRAAAMIGAVGISFGAGALIFGGDDIKGITDGKTELTVDAEEVDKDIVINNFEPSKHELFVNELKSYDQPEETQETVVDIEQQIRSEVREEIDQLTTAEAVLEYGKEIYAEAYNEQNEDKIEWSDIELNRSRVDFLIYEDCAQNGDTIYRIKYSGGNEDKSSEIYVTINTEEGKEVLDKVTNYEYKGNYYALYNSDEIVEKYEESTLVDVAPIVDSVISMKESMNNHKTSIDRRQQYKQELVDAVVEYRMEKEQEQNIESQQQNIENDGR